MDKKTVLIVDDEKDVLSVLEKALSTEGYCVLRAENGNDAVMLARSKHPDLIILDIVMPGIGGGEVAAMLRENPMTKDIPIIFQTCIISKTEETVACSLIAGNMFIAKPYSAEEMLAEVRKLA